MRSEVGATEYGARRSPSLRDTLRDSRLPLVPVSIDNDSPHRLSVGHNPNSYLLEL